MRVGLKMRMWLARDRDFGEANATDDPWTIPNASPPMPPETLAGWLGHVHPDVAELLRIICNRSGGEPTELSVSDAVRGSLGYVSEQPVNILGGTERLAMALARSLGTSLQTGARVRRVSQNADEVEIQVEANDRVITMRSRHCIIAAPADEARRMCVGLPLEYEEALTSTTYAPYVVLGAFTRERRARWDSIYAMAALYRAFSMMFNPANPLRTSGRRDPGGALVLYAAAQQARRLLDAPDDAIADAFLGDLYRVFPEARGTVGELVVARHERGVPRIHPGREAQRGVLLQPWGRVAFCGDHVWTAGLEPAIKTAVNAVRSLGIRDRTWRPFPVGW